jgi:Zn-dependent membrane protease YugP
MVVVAFQLVTLPVELDASRRAKKLLKEYGITTHQDDIEGVNTVLTSAALTYVAALASSVSTLLYYAIRLGLIGGKRRN